MLLFRPSSPPTIFQFEVFDRYRLDLVLLEHASIAPASQLLPVGLVVEQNDTDGVSL